MAKQIKITFAKGGTFLADLLEEAAPKTCQLIWDMLEKPWSETFVHSNIMGFMVESPYFPVPEDCELPLENLRCFTNNGDIAVITPAEYREMSIRGYLPLCVTAWHAVPLPTLTKLTGKKIDISHDTGERVNQQYKKNMMETCRANVFARIHADQIEEASNVVERIRTEGMEGYTIERA